jgi:hypothetical protein
MTAARIGEAPSDAEMHADGSRRIRDNAPLSPKRRVEHEPTDIAAMLRRVLRAMVRRAELGDIEAVRQLHLLERDVADAVAEAARGAHDGPARYTWSEIGAELEVSRQAARQRFGRRSATR